MKCDVLLFAMLRESIGCDHLSITLPDGACVRDAIDMLAKLYPPIAAMRNTLAIAVDEKYQTSDAPLHDGCIIAIIPPVSGG